MMTWMNLSPKCSFSFSMLRALFSPQHGQLANGQFNRLVSVGRGLAVKGANVVPVLVRQLWVAGLKVVCDSSEHYLESVSDTGDVRQHMVLTQWLLRGMAEDLHLMFDHFIIFRKNSSWVYRRPFQT